MVMETAMNICENCMWWAAGRGGYGDKAEGQCRANAPTMRKLKTKDTLRMDERAYWPVTKTDDYCGEHAPKVTGKKKS
jgi:hypothetical protein